MHIWSQSLKEGQPIPRAHAMGVASAGGPVPGPNRSPHLAWSGAPPQTKSFAVVCFDIDAPSRADDANKPDRTIRHDFARADFCHWVLVDISPHRTELAEALDSDGLTPKGKAPGATEYGVRGINNYREWFGSDPAMGGDYGGYDGPWPPFNDERVHRYVFTVYALDVASLGLAPRFDAKEALAAMKGHVLAEASLTGTYTLNEKARAPDGVS